MQYKFRRMRWAGHITRIVEYRGVYRVLVGTPEGRRPLGRPRCKWVDNIRTGEWRRIYNEELNDLYCSPNIVRVLKWRRMRWAGHVACMGEEREVYRVLVGEIVGKDPLGRPRRRWVDNIRMNLQKVGCGYMDWIGLAQDRDRWRRLVSAVMNLRVP